MKSSSAWLTSSAWVQMIACGPPAMTTDRALVSSAGSLLPVASQPAGIIGRDAGLARLRGLVDPVPQASQVLVVTGEAGIAKTVQDPR
jgi:hypothetical protein